MERPKDKSATLVLLSISLLLLPVYACDKKPSQISDEQRTPRSMEELTANMVLIPAGEFNMGSPPGKWQDDEHPQHSVYVDSFYMDKYEVTVGQYKEFIRATGHPSPPAWVSKYSATDNHPIIGVSWEDADAYAQWAGKRLPTEAEWEYACRAGSTAKYTSGDFEDALSEHAWYYFNSYGKPRPVGQKKPNAWGLYDMHGNVWEWCSDWYKSGYYKRSPTKNPKGPRNGLAHVARGGAWNISARNLRSATRGFGSPTGPGKTVGFRCAMDAE
jgi:formylglycine-generating enzyme required for sulfatase activity